MINDVGGSNRACCLVGMRLTVISSCLCILIHAMTDLLSSDSGPSPCSSCGLEVEELGILCDYCLQWMTHTISIQTTQTSRGLAHRVGHQTTLLQ